MVTSSWYWSTWVVLLQEILGPMIELHRCNWLFRYNRLTRIRQMRWEFGSILPPEVKYNLSEPEVCIMAGCLSCHSNIFIELFNIFILLIMMCYLLLFCLCLCLLGHFYVDRNCFRFCGSTNTVSVLQITWSQLETIMAWISHKILNLQNLFT